MYVTCFADSYVSLSNNYFKVPSKVSVIVVGIATNDKQVKIEFNLQLSLKKFSGEDLFFCRVLNSDLPLGS